MISDADLAMRCEPEHGCITCGDEAIPLRVVEVDEPSGLALCEGRDGRRESVEIALVGPVGPGDGVLVHAGTAIAEVGRSPTVYARPEAESPLQDAGLEAPRSYS